MWRIDQLRTGRDLGSGPSKPAHTLETLGLILIVVLILAFTIARSWHHIHWSAR